MDIVEYKIKEFLGDALLTVIVGQLIITDYTIDKFEKARQINKVKQLVCNDHLSLVAQTLKLVPHPDDAIKPVPPWKPRKEFANAYEAWLYEIYLTEGFEKAKEFVRNTVIDNDFKQLTE